MLKCFSGWTPSPGDSTCPEGSREFCRPSSPAGRLASPFVSERNTGTHSPIRGEWAPPSPQLSPLPPPPRKGLCLCSLLTRCRQEPQAVWRCEISCHKGALLARGVVGPGWGRVGEALLSPGSRARLPQGGAGWGGGRCLLALFSPS